jgi:hypothetical protein
MFVFGFLINTDKKPSANNEYVKTSKLFVVASTNPRRVMVSETAREMIKGIMYFWYMIGLPDTDLKAKCDNRKNPIPIPIEM